MSLARVRKPTLIVLSLLLALAVLGLAPQPAAPASGGNAITLKAPSFVQVANAQEEPAAAPMGFPQDEAGISAYFKSASPVTLADVRNVFRVIEAQTADYIIGSVQVPGYEEDQDTHVYVHRDGWFLTYYLQADPVGKILDWRRYTDNSVRTKFEAVLAVLAGASGVSFPGATYYDFRFPNANQMMFVVETLTAGGSTVQDPFQITLPSTYLYYHRSWSLGSHVQNCHNDNEHATYFLDGIQIARNRHCCDSWAFQEGTFSGAQLLPDQKHEVGLEVNCGDGWAGLVLLYRVP